MIPNENKAATPVNAGATPSANGATASAQESSSLSPLPSLRALSAKWRGQAAIIDSFHATMGSGWKACADDLDAVLGDASLKNDDALTRIGELDAARSPQHASTDEKGAQ